MIGFRFDRQTTFDRLIFVNPIHLGTPFRIDN